MILHRLLTKRGTDVCATKPAQSTLDYGISMPTGINMPGGTFGKTNKRASWKIGGYTSLS